MKKIFLSALVIALLSGSVFAANDSGGKKKNRKKAKTECKVENCDPKNCNPGNCDPKNCDPANCNPGNCKKSSTTVKANCSPASGAGN